MGEPEISGTVRAAFVKAYGQSLVTTTTAIDAGLAAAIAQWRKENPPVLDDRSELDG